MKTKRWFHKQPAVRTFALLFSQEDFTFTVKELQDAFDKVTSQGIEELKSLLGGKTFSRATLRSSTHLWVRDSTVTRTDDKRNNQQVYRINLNR